jgi:hypothetical protein
MAKKKKKKAPTIKQAMAGVKAAYEDEIQKIADPLAVFYWNKAVDDNWNDDEDRLDPRTTWQAIGTLAMEGADMVLWKRAMDFVSDKHRQLSLERVALVLGSKRDLYVVDTEVVRNAIKQRTGPYEVLRVMAAQIVWGDLQQATADHINTWTAEAEKDLG